jgi:GPI mannosyltransferase 2
MGWLVQPLEWPGVGSLLSPHRPRRSLVILFAAWKALLLLIVLSSRGPGYDTSTTLLDAVQSPLEYEADTIFPPEKVSHEVMKFVRWDAIYFTQISSRGYAFEQEWAFGIGFPWLLSKATSGAFGILLWLLETSHAASLSVEKIHLATAEVVIAVVVAHVCDLLSILLLHSLCKQLVRQDKQQSKHLPLLASVLRMVSPSGVFLSAPYSESLFSCLNFLGFLLFIHGRKQGIKQNHSLRRDVELIGSGIIFSLATLTRSNGLLGGFLFLHDLCMYGYIVLQTREFSLGIRPLVVIILGGLLVAIGYLLPQFVAYNSYCHIVEAPDRRPWCGSVLPSIYGWVQSYYWFVAKLGQVLWVS